MATTNAQQNLTTATAVPEVASTPTALASLKLLPVSKLMEEGNRYQASTASLLDSSAHMVPAGETAALWSQYEQLEQQRANLNPESLGLLKAMQKRPAFQQWKNDTEKLHTQAVVQSRIGQAINRESHKMLADAADETSATTPEPPMEDA